MHRKLRRRPGNRTAGRRTVGRRIHRGSKFSSHFGIKSYIQNIIDSFSKRILGFSVSRSISGEATTALLRSTLESAVPLPESPIMIISDGGSENVNCSVKEYLETLSLSLYVAHVDVSFSNSMIEAVNKILKYRYLFRKKIQSYLSVESVMTESVADYNERPHYKLQGLSPNEVHAGKIFDRRAFTERLNRAREHHLVENKNTAHPCTPPIEDIN